MVDFMKEDLEIQFVFSLSVSNEVQNHHFGCPFSHEILYWR